jgi:hypothetical protein
MDDGLIHKSFVGELKGYPQPRNTGPWAIDYGLWTIPIAPPSAPIRHARRRAPVPKWN